MIVRYCGFQTVSLLWDRYQHVLQQWYSLSFTRSVIKQIMLAPRELVTRPKNIRYKTRVLFGYQFRVVLMTVHSSFTDWLATIRSRWLSGSALDKTRKWYRFNNCLIFVRHCIPVAVSTANNPPFTVVHNLSKCGHPISKKEDLLCGMTEGQAPWPLRPPQQKCYMHKCKHSSD